ncbi:MAG TPA: hypothetical protein PL188_10055 [Candidatus Cloacimonadota bacterium]|jgi:hypothetical protein|nr:hypothetical protein [Candidatus Cloacimonadota bacterium]
MQFRFVKDLAVILIVILLGAMAIITANEHRKVGKVPEKSIYTRESVSDSLMKKIQTIENSIQDRKMFVFNSNKDPLRQGNIIKDKIDRVQEFEDMVRNMFRLATTAIDERGNKIAYIEYQDVLHEARVGQTVAGRRIIDIGDKTIRYSVGGQTYTAELMPRPVMKDDDPYQKTGISGNW